MLRNRVVLVQHDVREVPTVSAAITNVTLQRPTHFSTGEAAVEWLKENPCDLCVIDYQLPGTSGLETMLRIHHRFPNLPVIIISGEKTEDAVIAAFQAGATDYIPKRAGAVQALAQSVRRQLQQREHDGSSVASPTVVEQRVSPELVRPTYQSRLRAIGRQLDLSDYRSIVIMEVEGGFVVRVAPQGLRQHEALEFSDEQLPHLITSTLAARGEGEHQRPTNPLLPTGYKDFLRALGYELDRHNAESISLTELLSVVTIGALAQEEGFEHSAVSPVEWLLQANDIEALLNEAYGRRSAQPTDSKASVLSRLWRGSSDG